MRPSRTAGVFLALLSSIKMAQAADLTKLHIGYVSHNPPNISFYIAKTQGFFRSNSLDVELVFIRGGARLASAILAGELPFGFVSAATVFSAAAAGGDLVIVANLRDRLNHVIAGRPEIKRPEDLKGKVLGTSVPGSLSNIVTLEALHRFELDPKRHNISVINIGDDLTRAGALRAGRIAAAPLESSIGALLAKEGFSILLDFERENIRFPSAAMTTTRRFMLRNPDTVERAVKSLAEGVAYTLNPANKPSVTRALARYLQLDRVEKAEGPYEEVLRSTRKDLYPPRPEELVAARQMLARANPEAARVNPEAIVEPGFVRKLTAR